MLDEMEAKRKKHPIKDFFHTIQCKLESYLYDKPMDFFREIKWFIQRGRRGFADCDAWTLDNYLSKVIYKSILHLKENQNGYIDENLSKKEYDEILDKIIYAFHTAELISNGTYFYLSTYENKLHDYIYHKEKFKELKIDIVVMSWDDCKRYETGWDLFKKYYFSLWD